MTSDDIKGMYSMRDILNRYNIQPNKKGYVPCPFHAEKTASMKIYKDAYHCFGCGTHGDIFSFIMQMDNLSFKEVFKELGGGYQQSFSAKVKIYHAQKERERKALEADKHKKEIRLNNVLISVYRKWIEKSEPFSDIWCDCYNRLQYQLYLNEVLHEKR